MKKHLLLFHVLIIAITVIACNKNEYKEMRVYPVFHELAVARGGESFIAVTVGIPTGYHIYGNPKGPGIGKPTLIFVRSPQDLAFRAVRYLPPKKFYYPNEREYSLGYDHETMMFVPFKVRENTRPGLHTVSITFDALLCSFPETGGFPQRASVCIPKLFTFTYPIRVLPQGAAGTMYKQTVVSQYTISRAPQNRDAGPPYPPDTAVSMNGGTLPPSLHFTPRYIQTKISGLLAAVIFGIIAGFILNFTPCVLPVVSLKVMSFVQHADKNRKEVFLLGLTFSLGILTSFAVLASLAAFFGYLWGGLFQHRVFLVVMTGLVFALALSLLGVYTLNIPSVAGRAAKPKENMFSDAYLKGLLATLLATPCSGPFLGGTLAWTLSQPPPVIFLVFMCIGLGMSLPYLLLTVNPAFLKFVPKSGAWTKTFEQVMAFLLMFTVIYLITIFDEASKMPAITFLGFIAVGFWQYGKYGSIIYSRIQRLVSLILLIIIISAGYFLSFNYLYEERGVHEIGFRNFSVERMLENRNRGTISMVEFTAAWCPNCRLVEKSSLYTSGVASAVEAGGIDFMKADITSTNPAAERLLSLLGGQSIPVLAVIPPGKAFVKPIILRDIYSEKDVLKALEIARKESAGTNKGFKYRIDMGIK